MLCVSDIKYVLKNLKIEMSVENCREYVCISNNRRSIDLFKYFISDRNILINGEGYMPSKWLSYLDLMEVIHAVHGD